MDEKNPYNQHAKLLLNGVVLALSCGSPMRAETEEIPAAIVEAGWDGRYDFLPELGSDNFAGGVEAFAQKFGAKILHLDRIPADAPCMQIKEGSYF